ncbi:MAG: integrase, partial [Acidobacteriota bacterium]
MRLKALMPDYGCRKIAFTFNALHAGRGRRMAVGKSFVANVVKQSAAEIRQKQQELKHRMPRPIPKNAVWALDLTTIEEEPILGVIDHGTRACLELKKLPDKTTLTLLKVIINLVQRFGRPRALRTDNEAMFRSSLFTL